MFYYNKITTLQRNNILNRKKTIFLLENINISLNCSIIYLIKGKNGAGKSTLVENIHLNFINSTIIKQKIDFIFNLLQLYNRSYFNLIELKYIIQLSNRLMKLSYGYIKKFFLKIKWTTINKLFIFDESFNGLDKYFILKLNKLFLYITNTNNIKIQVTHLNISYKKKNILFLD